jgi:hypothetical protein
MIYKTVSEVNIQALSFAWATKKEKSGEKVHRTNH